MSQLNKKTFEVTVDEKTTKYAVLRPSHKVANQGQLIYSRAYIEACNAGVAVQDRMLKAIREQKLWDDEKQVRFEELVKNLLEGEKKLALGGNANLTKSQARELSVKMRMDRYELQALTTERNKYLSNTAESFAEQARFNYYVAACTVYADTGKPVFKDVEDYMGRGEDDQVAQQAGKLMATVIYQFDENFQKNLPENKFLLKYGFANEELHLIDPVTKHLVNVDGKPVNKTGQLVNDKDEPIDGEGNVLTETGEYKVEFVEFLDEEASPAQATEQVAA